MTAVSIHPPQKIFDAARASGQSSRIIDRAGEPLNISYRSQWNDRDVVPLYTMPETLVSAFVHSEDRKFYDHGGVDWRARLSALTQNAARGKTVRGASTITEQVVRMLTPRPRTLWSKWLEGIEATMLEAHTGKAQILEFYLNQVPYASGRRGIAQAARYYFSRDLSTLNAREMLALAVLARAPTAYDLYKAPSKIDAPLGRLAASMETSGLLTETQRSDISQTVLSVEKPSLPVEARHFARFVRLHTQGSSPGATTLDGVLQTKVQDILDQRVKKLSPRRVTNAAALVVDHETGDILAWAVAGSRDPATKGGDIDAVLAPRQPGSTLKPFVYAAALEKGWSAATILNDAPVAEAVGSGLHRFRNYGNSYYGPVTVREALGNSLNIPAVLAVRHVGVPAFYESLRALGFDSLDRAASIYDEGLALGNGEVTLYELVAAYSTLANRGETVPLRFSDMAAPLKARRVFSPENASLIGNILSDPKARAMEFGSDSVLNLPVRTALKTGTSTDYRDAWTVGYNDRYTVGIWMGNLDRTSMDDVTGSTGPALAARSIFAYLNRTRDTRPLYLSPSLVSRDVCVRPPGNDGSCLTRTEFFAPGTDVPKPSPLQKESVPELVRPTQGLMIARDSRIPAGHQKFRFELSGLGERETVEWIVDGKSVGKTQASTYLWPVEKGRHALEVRISGGESDTPFPPVTFTVR